MAEFERLIVQIFLSLIPVVGLYFSMKDRATKQENRLTVLEKDIENLNEFKKSANKRLDNHDEQDKSILVLAEQVKSLGEDVRELKTLIQSKT
ncbi:phage membrane protein [Streptococcus pneumoniae]|nr:phage membrane protein [Streptococcus pneumoniae]